MAYPFLYASSVGGGASWQRLVCWWRSSGWRFVGVVWTLACGGPGRLRCVRAFGTPGGRDALRPARPSHGRGLVWWWRCSRLALCWRRLERLLAGGLGRLRCVRAFGTLGGRDALRPARPSRGRGCLLWCLPAGFVRGGLANQAPVVGPQIRLWTPPLSLRKEGRRRRAAGRSVGHLPGGRRRSRRAGTVPGSRSP